MLFNIVLAGVTIYQPTPDEYDEKSQQSRLSQKKTVKMGAPDISRVLHSNLRKSQLPILAFGSS
ncbi:MAG: hypothetical protein WCK57_00020 [Verrucomicrobiae bacterium]